MHKHITALRAIFSIDYNGERPSKTILMLKCFQKSRLNMSRHQPLFSPSARRRRLSGYCSEQWCISTLLLYEPCEMFQMLLHELCSVLFKTFVQILKNLHFQPKKIQTSFFRKMATSSRRLRITLEA